MRMENQIHDIITGKLVLNGIDNTNEFINKVNEIGKQLYEKCTCRCSSVKASPQWRQNWAFLIFFV